LEFCFVEAEHDLIAGCQDRPYHDLWVGQQKLQSVSIIAYFGLHRSESRAPTVDNFRWRKPAAVRQISQLCRRERLLENVAVGIRNLALIKPSLGFAACASSRKAIKDRLAH